MGNGHPGLEPIQHQAVARPPRVLIETWLWMAEESSCSAVQELGQRRLVETFGSITVAKRYLVYSTER